MGIAWDKTILFMRGPDDGQMRVKLREGSGVSIFTLQEKLRKVLPGDFRAATVRVCEKFDANS